MAAAEAALAPAWVAIAEGRHKAAAFAGNPAATHPFLRGYSAAWVYATMATAGVSLLEKQRKYVQATDILRQLLGEARAAAVANHCIHDLLYCHPAEDVQRGTANKHICQVLLPAGAGGVCCSGRRGEWWTRLSIDTEHMGRIEEALEVTCLYDLEIARSLVRIQRPAAD